MYTVVNSMPAQMKLHNEGLKFIKIKIVQDYYKSFQSKVSNMIFYCADLRVDYNIELIKKVGHRCCIS